MSNTEQFATTLAQGSVIPQEQIEGALKDAVEYAEQALPVGTRVTWMNGRYAGVIQDHDAETLSYHVQRDGNDSNTLNVLYFRQIIEE